MNSVLKNIRQRQIIRDPQYKNIDGRLDWSSVYEESGDETASFFANTASEAEQSGAEEGQPCREQREDVSLDPPSLPVRKPSCRLPVSMDSRQSRSRRQRRSCDLDPNSSDEDSINLEPILIKPLRKPSADSSALFEHRPLGDLGSSSHSRPSRRRSMTNAKEHGDRKGSIRSTNSRSRGRTASSSKSSRRSLSRTNRKNDDKTNQSDTMKDSSHRSSKASESRRSKASSMSPRKESRISHNGRPTGPQESHSKHSKRNRPNSNSPRRRSTHTSKSRLQSHSHPSAAKGSQCQSPDQTHPISPDPDSSSRRESLRSSKQLSMTPNRKRPNPGPPSVVSIGHMEPVSPLRNPKVRKCCGPPVEITITVEKEYELDIKSLVGDSDGSESDMDLLTTLESISKMDDDSSISDLASRLTLGASSVTDKSHACTSNQSQSELSFSSSVLEELEERSRASMSKRPSYSEVKGLVNFANLDPLLSPIKSPRRFSFDNGHLTELPSQSPTKSMMSKLVVLGIDDTSSRQSSSVASDDGFTSTKKAFSGLNKYIQEPTGGMPSPLRKARSMSSMLSPNNNDSMSTMVFENSACFSPVRLFSPAKGLKKMIQQTKNELNLNSSMTPMFTDDEWEEVPAFSPRRTKSAARFKAAPKGIDLSDLLCLAIQSPRTVSSDKSFECHPMKLQNRKVDPSEQTKLFLQLSESDLSLDSGAYSNKRKASIVSMRDKASNNDELSNNSSCHTPSRPDLSAKIAGQKVEDRRFGRRESAVVQALGSQIRKNMQLERRRRLSTGAIHPNEMSNVIASLPAAALAEIEKEDDEQHRKQRPLNQILPKTRRLV